MSHLLHYAEGSIIAVVDPSVPGSPVPLTGAPKKLTGAPRGQHAFGMPATWGNAAQLAETLRGAIASPEYTSWVTEQLLARTAYERPTRFDFAVERDPYPWQMDAAGRFASIGSTLLSDDPGTGKTTSALLGLQLREARHGDAFPALVIAPASVLSSWASEAETLGLTVARWDGKRALPGTHVTVVSYDRARISEAKLKARGFRAVVVDEHHLIKNMTAKRTTAVVSLCQAAGKVIALSGTPITHGPDDQFPVLKAMDRGTWPSRQRFIDRFCETVDGPYSTEVIGILPHREEELKTCLLGVWRRVSKADALSHLPPKVYSTRTVELPPEHRKAYDRFAETMSTDLPDGDGQLDVMDTLSRLTRLSQLASAPCTVTVEETGQYDVSGQPITKDVVTMHAPSWKVGALMEVLAERPDQQVLAFSPSRQLIGLAADALEQAGISYGLIVGGQSTPRRDASVRDFQEGRLRCMLATTQAGGVGLTLTAASTVVFLSRPYSLVDSLQAEDRAHRIGSERHESIEIIDVEAAGTIEQRVRAILAERGGTLRDFLRNADDARALLS